MDSIHHDLYHFLGDEQIIPFLCLKNLEVFEYGIS